MRIIPLYLLLLPCLTVKSQDHPVKEFWAKWDAGGGLTGASINFHQNGISGFNFRGVYHFLEWGKSSFSLGLDWRIGTEDENGLFFPVEVAASIPDRPHQPAAPLSAQYPLSGIKKTRPST